MSAIKLTKGTEKTSSGKSNMQVSKFEFDSSLSYNAVQKDGVVYVKFDVDASEINGRSPLRVNNSSIRIASSKQECGYKEFYIEHYETKRLNHNITKDTKQVFIVLDLKNKFEG